MEEPWVHGPRGDGCEDRRCGALCLRRSGMPSAVDELMTLAGLKASIAAASVCVCAWGRSCSPVAGLALRADLQGAGQLAAAPIP